MRMNRMANAKNEYQGKYKRVLTVCSAGMLRSPTLAHLLFEEYGFNTRSAGSSKDYALIRADEVLLHWADEIVFIEQENLDETRAFFDVPEEKAFVLNIPDNYEYMNDSLQQMLLDKYREIVMNRDENDDLSMDGDNI